MNARLKAQELKDKYYLMMPTVQLLKEERILAIKYSIVCVNEITRENLVLDVGSSSDVDTITRLTDRYNFWKKVLNELNTELELLQK